MEIIYEALRECERLQNLLEEDRFGIEKCVSGEIGEAYKKLVTEEIVRVEEIRRLLLNLGR